MPNPTGPDRQRADSFGAVAGAYAEYRPGYPDAAVDTALDGAISTAPGGAPRRVLDLGAGTGKLTASLRRRAEVVAVEPDPQMLDRLRADLPDVDARTGPAESIPLPDRYVDAIVVGQAMHWFDLDRAVPEMARVLRPGGVLAGLWNTADHDVGWVRGVAEIVADGEPLPPRPGDPDYGPAMPGEPWFAPGALSAVRWWRPRTTRAVLAELGTYSRILTRDEERRAATMRRLRAYLDGRPETASGVFDEPVVTLVWRTLRR